MAQNVGYIYGRARVKKLEISAGDNINKISMSYSSNTSSLSSNEYMSSYIAPGEKVTLSAELPADVLSGILYHDGDIPKANNYYYNNNTVYSFSAWRDKNSTTLSSSASYQFDMPINDLQLIASATVNVSEINKVYAIPVTIINNSSSYIANVYGTRESTTTANTLSAVVYIWPGETVTIGGNPGSSSAGSIGYSGCDSNHNPLSSDAYMYQDTTVYYIKNITDGSSNIVSNDTLNGPSSVDVNPITHKTYSVNGSYSVVRNSTYCDSSTSEWTSEANNASCTTTSSIRSTKYWFSNNVNYSYGKTETYGVEVISRYLGNSSVYATNGASTSSWRSVTSVVQATSINGVLKGSNVVGYSNRHGYATVSSSSSGSTNGVYTTSATMRTTSSSFSTGYGETTDITVYTGSNRSTYGTTHYISTSPTYAYQYAGYAYQYKAYITYSIDRSTWLTKNMATFANQDGAYYAALHLSNNGAFIAGYYDIDKGTCNATVRNALMYSSTYLHYEFGYYAEGTGNLPSTTYYSGTQSNKRTIRVIRVKGNGLYNADLYSHSSHKSSFTANVYQTYNQTNSYWGRYAQVQNGSVRNTYQVING